MFRIKKDAKILIVFSLVCTFGVSNIIPYIPIFGREIGMPVALIGNLVLLYYLLQAVTRIPLGRLSDLIGHHKPILLGSLLYFSSALAFLASLKVWPLLFLGEVFLGLANSITWVTVPSYITSSSNALPVYSFSVGLGWLIGSPTGGYIKDAFGMKWVFITLLVVALVLIYLSWLFYFESSDLTRRESVKDFIRMSSVSPSTIPIYPSMKSYLEGWRLLRSNSALLFASLFSFIVFMTFGLGASVVPLYFSEIGIASFFIGILISIRVATSTFIKLTCRKLTKYFGDYKVLIVSTVVAGLFIVLVSLTEIFVFLAIFSGLWGLGSGLYLPIVFDIIGKNTEEEERGIAMGIRGTLGTLGAAFGTWAFSILAGSFSLAGSLLAAGVFAALGSVVLGFIFR
ncbi:MAG: MFS transporter [Candidatus Bipolaricaulota bacterium]|nr:MFS transporter [Candidatus Bipolaricaulota bacterium]MBS3791734.1 MFS transporter [Candidatus Bipolaricaulota bacterium]